MKTKSIRILINFLGIVIIPLCVAFVLKVQNNRQQEKDLRAKYVEIAVNILAAPNTNQELREWATTNLDSFAEIKLPKKVKKELNSGRNLYGSTIVGAPVEFSFKQVKIANTYTANQLRVKVYCMSGGTLRKRLILDQQVNLQKDNNSGYKKAVNFTASSYITKQSVVANTFLFIEMYHPVSNQLISSKPECIITNFGLPAIDAVYSCSGQYKGMLILDIQKIELE